jgi:metallo-beta-lactamase family protein
MSHGGRIGKHEIKYLPDPKSTLIVVGYQAPGSPGRLLVEGAKQVKLNGQMVTIRAKVANLHGWSAHADRDELLKYAEEALKDKRTKTIFTALGEPASERFLAQRIHDYLGGNAIAPEMGQTWEITKESVRKV